MTLHPDFKRTAQSYDFDLALVRLNRKVDLTAACLPPTMPVPGAFCRISGWGQFSHNFRSSRKLKSAHIHIVDKATCQRVYPHQVKDRKDGPLSTFLDNNRQNDLRWASRYWRRRMHGRFRRPSGM